MSTYPKALSEWTRARYPPISEEKEEHEGPDGESKDLTEDRSKELVGVRSEMQEEENEKMEENNLKTSDLMMGRGDEEKEMNEGGIDPIIDPDPYQMNDVPEVTENDSEQFKILNAKMLNTLQQKKKKKIKKKGGT